jgi:asparagine synthase (glutamine-hydrolysing)
MCGITGFVDYTKSFDQSSISKMTDAIYNRGPDGGDTIFETQESLHLALGHRRLSIIDLSDSANQPLHYRHLSLVYNGEIYNYQEIKIRLQEIGYKFTTNNDSEVLIIAYHEWGENCLDHFIGMFAFSVYDRNKQEIFVARDRFGVKPFYYVNNTKLFAFASEIKGLKTLGILSKIESTAVSHYFQYGYTGSEATIYSEVQKLPPGTYGRFNLKTRKFTSQVYWSADVFFNAPPYSNKSNDEIMNDIEQLIVSSCKYRLVSDVPVGVFLSGGYDSSLVAAICNKINPGISTFTISFSEKEFDEGVHAKQIASYLGTKHHTLLCDETEAVKFAEILPGIYDEPFGDSSAIPTLLLSQLTKKHVKVSLSADGGDEFFAGYTRYAQLKKIYQYKSLLKVVSPLIPKSLVANTLSRKIYNPIQRIQKVNDIIYSNSPTESLNILTSYFSRQDVNSLLVQSSLHNLDTAESNLDFINKLLLSDTINYLPNDILTKVDRASMYYGLESREPLLDHNLFEYVARLPGEQKLCSNNLKYLLKNITHKYIPKEMVNRPKKGFSVPIKKWMTTIYKEEFLDLLNDETIKREGLLNLAETRKYKDDLINNKNINFQKLWILFQFQKWTENHFKG